MLSLAAHQLLTLGFNIWSLRAALMGSMLFFKPTRSPPLWTLAGLAADDATDCVRLLDDQTFETLDRHVLGGCELACSISSISFANDPAVYYVVGTAVAVPEEPEPTKVS